MYHSKTVDHEDHSGLTRDDMLQELMTEFGQQIQQLAYTYVKEPNLAEDLTQDIFLKVYRKLHTFKQGSSLKTWLYRIAINHCKDYVKSWHYKQVVADNAAIDQSKTKGASLEQQVISRSEQELLVQAVLLLPIKYREPVYLYYYEDLNTRTISKLTGKNENTVKTRLNRARKLIKKKLEESQ